jgi:hypothetical protein
MQLAWDLVHGVSGDPCGPAAAVNANVAAADLSNPNVIHNHR